MFDDADYLTPDDCAAACGYEQEQMWLAELMAEVPADALPTDEEIDAMYRAAHGEPLPF